MLINRCESDMVHQWVQTNQIYNFIQFYMMVMAQASLDSEGSATSPSITFLMKSLGSMVMDPLLAMYLLMTNTLPSSKPQTMLTCIPQTVLNRTSKTRLTSPLNKNLPLMTDPL